MTGDVARRLGVLAFGDSITNGGGELQWGVALQSWALWLARGLGLPFTNYAVDGARVTELVEHQIPSFLRLTADPEAAYDVGCLYVGANDVRALEWDASEFAAAYGRALSFVGARCERVLAVTVPLDLGRPRAGTRVLECNQAIHGIAAEQGALLVDLSDFRARNQVMADRVHPTAFGQIAIAERALGVLERDGLPARVAPHDLIVYETSFPGRLRADLTYCYRYAKGVLRAWRDEAYGRVSSDSSLRGQ